MAVSWVCDLGPVVAASPVERSECLHRVAMCCVGRACEFTCDRLGTARRGVLTTCLFTGQKLCMLSTQGIK